MTDDERQTVAAIMRSMSSAVEAAWARHDKEAAALMKSAITLAATIGVK